MKCPVQHELQAFVDGTLDDTLIEGVGEHLCDCQKCEATVVEFETALNPFVEMLRIPGCFYPIAEPEYCSALTKLTSLTPVVTDRKLTPASERVAFEPPAVVGEYQLFDKIAGGGMGLVYRARHVRMGRGAALKLVPSLAAWGPQSESRFEREVFVAGQLDHPNVVKTYDAGTDGGVHFLAMELLEGVNFRELLTALATDGDGLSICDACELIRQTAMGLQHAHENTLVHRDVKPSNIMLTSDGEVKLLDMGLALSLNEDADLTQTGQVMGTFDYLAPEQAADSHRVDQRADLYSLGCTLFFVLTGKVPYPRKSGPATLVAHLKDPIPSVHEKRDDCPRELEQLITSLLEKDPADRPQSCADVAELLAPFCDGADLSKISQLYVTPLPEIESLEQHALRSAEMELLKAAELRQAKSDQAAAKKSTRLRSSLILAVACSLMLIAYYSLGPFFGVGLDDGRGQGDLHKNGLNTSGEPNDGDEGPTIIEPLLLASLSAEHAIRELSVSSDGRSLAWIDSQGKVSLFAWDGKEAITPLANPISSDIGATAISFSRDSKQLGIGFDNRLSLYDAKTGKHQWSRYEKRRINGVDFSPAEPLYITAHEGQFILIWDSESHELAYGITHRSGELSAAEFSGDGNLFSVRCASDGALLIWDTAYKRVVRLPTPPSVTQSKWSASGTTIAYITKAGELQTASLHGKPGSYSSTQTAPVAVANGGELAAVSSIVAVANGGIQFFQNGTDLLFEHAAGVQSFRHIEFASTPEFYVTADSIGRIDFWHAPVLATFKSPK